MIKVDNELVDKLADLAKLNFDGEAKEDMKNNFQRILNFVEQLNEVDTEGVEPLIHISDSINDFREDIAENTISHEDALANAPQKDSDYFKVPKVLSK